MHIYSTPLHPDLITVTNFGRKLITNSLDRMSICAYNHLYCRNVQVVYSVLH